MTREELEKALKANGGPVKVVSASKVEYWLCSDVGGLQDPNDRDPYVYGERVTPLVKFGHRRRVNVSGTKWFFLRNVKLVA